MDRSLGTVRPYFPALAAYVLGVVLERGGVL
jgi:hypothetical protein